MKPTRSWAAIAGHDRRDSMSRNPAAEPGCCHASCPNYLEGAAAQVTGNGNHYVAQAAGLISATLGTF